MVGVRDALINLPTLAVVVTWSTTGPTQHRGTTGRNETVRHRDCAVIDVMY